ncbi:MAG TPA: DUF2203 family protein [archaeon]|nr:DUF2203 family protein [archaeon]
MSKIYYSVAQANTLIPKIKRTVEKIEKLRDEIFLIDNTKILFDELSPSSLLLEIELNKNFHEKNLEMFTLIAELIREGCLIRNLEEEIEVDFYSKFKDKDIFLCWKIGDDTIRFWHETFEKQKQRKPIEELQEHYYEKLKELK